VLVLELSLDLYFSCWLSRPSSGFLPASSGRGSRRRFRLRVPARVYKSLSRRTEALGGKTFETVSCSAIQFSGSAWPGRSFPAGEGTCSPTRSARQGKPSGPSVGFRTGLGEPRTGALPALLDLASRGGRGQGRSALEHCPDRVSGGVPERVGA